MRLNFSPHSLHPIVFSLCLLSTHAIATNSAQHDAIVTEFFHLYHSCGDCAIGVQTVEGRFGATTFSVNADPSALCEKFTSVAPDLNYVIRVLDNGAYKYASCD